MQMNGILAQYVDDVDAAVLTGFTAKPNGGFVAALAAADPAIAAENVPSRFADP